MSTARNISPPLKLLLWGIASTAPPVSASYCARKAQRSSGSSLSSELNGTTFVARSAPSRKITLRCRLSPSVVDVYS